MSTLSPDVAKYIWDNFLDLESKARAHTCEWRYALFNRYKELWPMIIRNRAEWEPSACRALQGLPLTVHQGCRIYKITAQVEWGHHLRLVATLPGHRNHYSPSVEESWYGSISVKLPGGVRVLTECPSVVYCGPRRFIFSLADGQVVASVYNASSLTAIERLWISTRHL
jgi:hypothetical protein